MGCVGNGLPPPPPPEAIGADAEKAGQRPPAQPGGLLKLHDPPRKVLGQTGSGWRPMDAPLNAHRLDLPRLTAENRGTFRCSRSVPRTRSPLAPWPASASARRPSRVASALRTFAGGRRIPRGSHGRGIVEFVAGNRHEPMHTIRRLDVRLEERVEAAGDAGRQQDQREQPIPARPGSLPPALELTRVHAEAAGQPVPREAAGLLKALEPRREIFREEGDAKQQVGRGYGGGPHAAFSRVNRSSNRSTASASMSLLRTAGDGKRVPVILCER